MSRKVIFHRSIRLIEKFDRSVLLLFPRFSTPRMYTTLLGARCCYTRRRLSSREKVVGDETSGAEARKRERESEAARSSSLEIGFRFASFSAANR